MDVDLDDLEVGAAVPLALVSDLFQEASNADLAAAPVMGDHDKIAGDLTRDCARSRPMIELHVIAFFLVVSRSGRSLGEFAEVTAAATIVRLRDLADEASDPCLKLPMLDHGVSGPFRVRRNGPAELLHGQRGPARLAAAAHVDA